MNFLLILIFVFFSLGQLGRISFFNQQVNFYIYEVILVSLLLILFFKYRLFPIKKLWNESKSIYFFISALTISFILGIYQFTVYENLVGLLYFLRLVVYLLYWIYLSYWQKKENKNSILQNSIKIFIYITILTTGLQYLFYPNLRNLLYQGWDPHLYRAFGVFFDTGVAASIFGIMVLLSKNKLVKPIYFLFLVLSFSRSAYFALTATFIYLLFTRNQVKKIILYLILGLTLVIFVPKPEGEGVNLFRTFSIVSRAKDNLAGWELFKKKPIFGYGYNRLRFVKNEPVSHSGSAFSSSYLTILVAGGLIGFSGWLFFLKFLWLKSKKYRGIFLFLSIASVFDNIILHPFILFLFFTILSDS